MKIEDISDSRTYYKVKKIILEENEMVPIHCPYCKNPLWISKSLKDTVICVKCKTEFKIERKNKEVEE